MIARDILFAFVLLALACFCAVLVMFAIGQKETTVAVFMTLLAYGCARTGISFMDSAQGRINRGRARRRW